MAAELEQLVATRRDGDVAGAINRIRTDRSKADMDRARGLIGELETEERTLLTKRQEGWQAAQGLSQRVSASGSRARPARGRCGSSAAARRRAAAR